MKYTEKGSNCPDKYTKLFRGIITTIVISSASVLYAQELSFSAIDGAPLSVQAGHLRILHQMVFQVR